jgi:hypothetical protein
MEPRTFPEATHMAADDQPEFLLLPVLRDETVTHSCWALSDRELELLKMTKCVWVSQLTGYGPIQPLKLAIECPFEAGHGTDKQGKGVKHGR